MGGIDNDVVYGTNFDFSGNAQVAATMTADGQLLIGNSAGQPQVNTLTSTGGTITITNGNGTINLDTAGGMALATLTGNAGGAVSPDGANNIDLLGTATNGINITGTPASNLLTIAMQSPYADGDFEFRSTTTTRTLSVTNTNNASGTAHSNLSIESGGAGGGDPFLHLSVNGVTEYSFGLDNSASDYLRITDGASPSAGTNWMTLGNNGVKDFISFFTFNVPSSIDESSFFVADSQVGGNVGLRCANSDNTDVGSDAIIEMITGGANGGDPAVNFTISGVLTHTMGIDNSDSDKLCINTSADRPSTASASWIMTNAGERTMPEQPAFSAYKSANSANVVGQTATIYTVIFDTEVFDQNADYNNGTGVFTAPVTGRYQFNVSVFIGNVDAGMTNAIVSLVTTARTYSFGYDDILTTGNSLNDGHTYNASFLADMTATDTASVTAEVQGGAGNTADIFGAAIVYTGFSGYLVC